MTAPTEELPPLPYCPLCNDRRYLPAHEGAPKEACPVCTGYEAYGRALLAKIAEQEKEITELKRDYDLLRQVVRDYKAERDELRAKLEAAVLALHQLADIWDAGMPDETARQDMVEAFAAVRTMFAIGVSRAEKP